MSDDDDDGEAGAATAGTQRLDKWLWYTRVVKSRTLAAGLVSDGKVRLNRQRVEKPSQAVRCGDVVTAAVHRQVRVLRVVELGHRRGPPAEARLLYEDITVVEGAERPRPAKGAPGPVARPDKRDRRELAALKRRPVS